MLTTYNGGDHDPYVLDNSIYYLSEERTNHFNVWEMNSDGGKKRQITDFKTHPVRHLSVSNKKLLCYTHHGQIYTQQVGDPPKRIAVEFKSDSRSNEYETKTLTNISEFAVSPNGRK